MYVKPEGSVYIFISIFIFDNEDELGLDLSDQKHI